MSEVHLTALDLGNPMALSDLADKINQLTKQKVKVGWFENMKYPDTLEPVAQVAMKNEFGIGVPARPFMRPAIVDNKQKWGTSAIIQAKNFVNDRIDKSGVYDGIGSIMIADIQEAIIAVQEPPLAASTIEKRRARYNMTASEPTPVTLTKPLIDTGKMIASVSMQVTDA